MYHNLLQKTRNKILKTIDSIPYRQYQSEIAYQVAVEQYSPYLVDISETDLEIVEKIKQEGVFITSLSELGIASSYEFMVAAQNLIPHINPATYKEQNNYVIHATSQQIMANPMIFLWGLEQRLLNIVENFFALPVAYHGVYLRRDVANNCEIGSRLWHLDKEAKKVLKIIVYLHDMNDNNGPFQYIHPSLTPEIAKSLKYKAGYICDESMQEVISTSEYRSCTGLAGTVVFAATHNIFHRGKIPIASDRFSVFFDYTPRLKEHSYYITSSLANEDLVFMAEHLSESQKQCIFQ